MSGDSRKDFILATISNFFGYSINDGAVSHICDSKELNNFLDDGNCLMLATHAELTQGVRLIQVYNGIESDASSDNWLVFFKLQPTVIVPDNVHTNIFVSTMLDSPVDTLYHTVQKVFAPVLLNDSKWNKKIDPKIQVLLTELEAGLGSTLRRFGKSEIDLDKTYSFDSNLAGILTPSDEFQYWSEASSASSKLTSRERAQYFQEMFQPIVTKFANLDVLSFPDCLELIEICQDTLDDIWKQTEHSPPYPEDRMKHLLEIISDSFGRFVQHKLMSLDIWSGPFNLVRNSLQDGLALSEKWLSVGELLTSQFWKQYPLHQWKGSVFASQTLSQLIERLEEVLSLRSLQQQLLQLLSPAEQQEFSLSTAFAPFTGKPYVAAQVYIMLMCYACTVHAGLQCLQHNPYTKPLWKSAVAQYQRGINPAELRIANKLRGKFRQLEATPHQLLREFQRYRELVKRPSISKELVTERWVHLIAT